MGRVGGEKGSLGLTFDLLMAQANLDFLLLR